MCEYESEDRQEFFSMFMPFELRVSGFNNPSISEAVSDEGQSATLILFENKYQELMIIMATAEGEVAYKAFNSRNNRLLADLTPHIIDGRKVEVHVARNEAGFDITVSPVV